MQGVSQTASALRQAARPMNCRETGAGEVAISKNPGGDNVRSLTRVLPSSRRLEQGSESNRLLQSRGCLPHRGPRRFENNPRRGPGPARATSHDSVWHISCTARFVPSRVSATFLSHITSIARAVGRHKPLSQSSPCAAKESDVHPSSKLR